MSSNFQIPKSSHNLYLTETSEKCFSFGLFLFNLHISGSDITRDNYFPLPRVIDAIELRTIQHLFVPEIQHTRTAQYVHLLSITGIVVTSPVSVASIVVVITIPCQVVNENRVYFGGRIPRYL